MNIKTPCFVILLNIIFSNAIANNVGYAEKLSAANKLWAHQVNVQIDAVDFDYDYEFERAVIEQVSIAFLAISRHFYIAMDENEYLNFNIRFIESYERFLAVQKQEVGRIISHTGYYSLGSTQITVLKNRSNTQTFRALKHEACHKVLHKNTENRARWLNEGIAENCEFAKYDYINSKVVINSNKGNHRYVGEMAKSAKLLSLNSLFEWGDNNQGQSDDAILKQVQSGEFIYYLLQLPGSTHWLSELLQQKGAHLDIQQTQIQDRLIDLQSDFESWLVY